MKVKRSADDLMEYLKDSIVILESSIKDYNYDEIAIEKLYPEGTLPFIADPMTQIKPIKWRNNV